MDEVETANSSTAVATDVVPPPFTEDMIHPRLGWPCCSQPYPDCGFDDEDECAASFRELYRVIYNNSDTDLAPTETIVCNHCLDMLKSETADNDVSPCFMCDLLMIDKWIKFPVTSSMEYPAGMQVCRKCCPVKAKTLDQMIDMYPDLPQTREQHVIHIASVESKQKKLAQQKTQAVKVTLRKFLDFGKPDSLKRSMQKLRSHHWEAIWRNKPETAEELIKILMLGQQNENYSLCM